MLTPDLPLRSNLTDLDAIKKYLIGGYGTFTLVGKHSRFTYKFSRPDTPSPYIFVRTLTGSDNIRDYTYIGYLNDSLSNPFVLYVGNKGKPDAPSFKALDWFLTALVHNPAVVGQAEFWHEGVCCRCGRKLTVPESVAAGIGPTCAGKE